MYINPIEWTDATWNPIRGCSRVSEGCRNCYAETIAKRFSYPGGAYDGLVRLDSKFLKPQGWSGDIKFVEEHLLNPLKWKPGRPIYDASTGKQVGRDTTKPLRIFVNSMPDLFHENVTDEMRDKIFAVMALCPQHTFQVLTKRSERMLAYFQAAPYPNVQLRAIDIVGEHVEAGRPGWHKILDNRPVAAICNKDGWTFRSEFPWPLPNVQLGVSVENQPEADKRIPYLLQTPAAVRFISAEPLLGCIDLDRLVLKACKLKGGYMIRTRFWTCGCGKKNASRGPERPVCNGCDKPAKFTVAAPKGQQGFNFQEAEEKA